MNLQTAHRLEGIGEYYFSQKLKEIDAMNKVGQPVLNLGIGSPDLPPHPDVIKTLQEEAAKPTTHAYQSYKGAEVFRNAIRDWYQKWYGVELNPATEILPLIGSKEGIMHICMTYLNKGDKVLIPNPGYPTYSSAVQLAGGECVPYELKEANNYFPDFDAIEREIAPLPPKGGVAKAQPSPVGDVEEDELTLAEEAALEYKTADPMTYSLLKEFVRHHRSQPTQAEDVLWEQLRGKQLDRFKFRRQHIIGNFIADFVNLKNKLVIEVDGLMHQLPQNQISDEERTQWLNEKGYKVIRFSNEEVMHQTELVLQSILNTLKPNHQNATSSQSGPQSEALATPPLGGGGAVKLMWVNYPHMPTGQLPTKELFKQLVAFGKKHNILICHDNPYSFILNDNPQSMLAVEGAKDVVLELNSLSKSHNMAGWRVGMLCGGAQRINEVLRFKSNMDSGMFLPVQLAAAKALELDKSWYEGINQTYAERRTKAYELLDVLGCTYSKAQAGMFVWAAVPSEYEDGFALSDAVLHGARVFITPGGIFGSAGTPFIRISLCSPIEKLAAAIQRIKESTAVNV